jgi:hypothetical protein
MQSLYFDAQDVRRVIEHSISAEKQFDKTVYDAGGEQKVAIREPAVILGHDEGVYLMSNGEPRDLINEVRSFVAYARGCHPFRDANYRVRSRELVGGDDFSLVLTWANDLKKVVDTGATTIVLNLYEDRIDFAAM